MRTYTGIQAMRGVAAFAVVLGHLVTARWGMGLTEFSANTLLGVLRSGVDVFFVISGFIIGLTADKIGKTEGRRGVARFAIKRAIRIFPLYWIVFVVVVLTIILVPGLLSGLPKSAALDASLAKQFFLVTNETTFIPPAWSMCFEVAFYATVTVVLLVAPTRVMATLIALIITLAIVDLTPLPHAPGILTALPLILEFAFGVAVAWLINSGVTALWKPCLFVAVCLFAFAASKTWGLDWVYGMQRIATFGIGSALAIYGVTAAELGGATFPRWTQDFGAMSYSMYVWHMPLLAALASTADLKFISSIPGPLQLLIWILIVLACAALSYRYIERPILDRFSKRRGALRRGGDENHAAAETVGIGGGR